MSPETISSFGALLVGVLGGISALVLALRKRVAEEDVPALKKRVEDLETLRRTDKKEYEERIAEVERLRESDLVEHRREINTTRAEILTLDRRYYEFQRFAVSKGLTVPDNLRRLSPRNGPPAGAPDPGVQEEGPAP
jgi:acetyl-CoA carboxylase carboxyltransferase component